MTSRYGQEQSISGRIQQRGGEVSAVALLPDWLFSMIPSSFRDRFYRIVEVDLHGSKVDDATLDELLGDLRCLSNLRILRLNSSSVTDRGIAGVATLERLELLELWSCDCLSADAVCRLQAALPCASIFHSTNEPELAELFRRPPMNGASRDGNVAAQRPCGDLKN